ncbi:hypothetical protein [Flavobacterium aciduliphilum]|uniref:Uncharacterized protein n=1 Tax=Flavobacterium aciduliphilum TaxID=1101402 RepID=A0A328YFQ0_9FLAO|nr:hypothetical protein [Flavobacterium aciduliphilum]RAR71505.1 hypothetical protein CLV55_10761 [Flavobacterium aciduliphilum]
MEAYITSHNAQKIINRNNFKNIQLSGEVYKHKLHIFSKNEENSLLAIQELFKNPEKYFKEIYNPMIVFDSKKYIYKEQQPAYHTSKDCPRLHSDFTNFELPQEIIERGDAEIERFRTWFIENRYLLERPDAFVMRLELAFKIKYNPKAISYENSGFSDFKNYSLEQLEKEIDSLIKEAGRYFYASGKNTSILRIFGKYSACAFSETSLYNNNTGYSDHEVKIFLKDYHMKFKVPLKKLLIEYYRVKLNPTLEFAETFMDALGFRKCGACKKRELEASVNLFLNTFSLEKRNEFIDLPF